MAKRKLAAVQLPKSEVELPDPVKLPKPDKSEFPMPEGEFQKTVLDTLIKLTEVALELKQASNSILKVARAGKF